MVLVILFVVLVVLEVVLVALGVVLVVLHGAQRQCSEQMFGTDVRNRQCSEQCSEPTKPGTFVWQLEQEYLDDTVQQEVRALRRLYPRGGCAGLTIRILVCWDFEPLKVGSIPYRLGRY